MTRHGNRGSASPTSPEQRGTPSSSTGTWDPARARSVPSVRHCGWSLRVRRRSRGCASGRSTGAGSSAAGPTIRTRHSSGPGEETRLHPPPAAARARRPSRGVRRARFGTGRERAHGAGGLGAHDHLRRQALRDRLRGTRAATAARAPVPLPNCGLGSPCTSGDSMRARSCDSLAGSRSERNPSRRWTPSGASAGSSSMRMDGPVPTGRIERLVLRSTTGEVRVVRSELGRPRWLFSRRVSLIRGKPVAQGRRLRGADASRSSDRTS